jgi:hypothetical protein
MYSLGPQINIPANYRYQALYSLLQAYIYPDIYLYSTYHFLYVASSVKNGISILKYI